MLVEQLHDLRLLALAKALLDRQMVKWNLEVMGNWPGVGMVRDDRDDLAIELAGAMPDQQIVEAVILLRDQDRGAPAPIAIQPIVHAEPLADLAYVGFECAVIEQAREIEAQPLEE